MARKVRQIRQKGKQVTIPSVPPTAAPDFDTRMALIQALIPVALERVHQELKNEVTWLAGERYAREGRRPGHVRWTRQRGSISLADQKIPIEGPRVCDRLRDQRIDLGLLVVTDGAKGLHAAVREVFGAVALLQRCQWHKRENVLAYLPARRRPAFRRKLQAAYEQSTYEAATRALGKVRAELTLLNTSAAASLDEGVEETLTLHRLGLLSELGVSLKTTNILESIHARVEDRTARVDHWPNSEQKQRWLATALLDLEPRLHRIKNYRSLPLLRDALTRHVPAAKKSAA